MSSPNDTKLCPKCQQWKPATSEYFNVNNRAKDKLAGHCKVCKQEYRARAHQKIYEQKKRWRENNPEKEKARVTKWIAENREYVQSQSKARYEQNREDILRKQREYNSQNRDTIRQRIKQRYDSNRDSILAARKLRYNDPEVRLKAQKRAQLWRIGNLSKAKANSKARKAKQRAEKWGMVGNLSAKELLAMFAQQNGRCFYCGITLSWDISGDIHTDHVNPLSRGGRNDTDNVVIACADCNQSKSYKTLEEWQKVRGW